MTHTFHSNTKNKEIEEKTVNVRTRQNEVLGSKSIVEFIKDLQEEKSSKRINTVKPSE
mgnify:CR=1 FL=1